ncbi:MAG: hypothetical protein ACM34I_11625 [bacterium]
MDSSIKPAKSLVNVLGVVYVHTRTSDGGDLYLTRFAESYQRHFEIENWHEKSWFDAHKIRLRGTSSVYKVPTKEVAGKSLDLVVKTCRVGEDVPLATHILEEFCNAEFNSPWEEFSLVTEMREGHLGMKHAMVNTQLPMAIYVPPERMQQWQSGRSRAKINRIRDRHPGIDLDILKQYKMIYEWVVGKNLVEIFEQIAVELPDLIHHLKTMNYQVLRSLNEKGYLIADMKPEHIIIGEDDVRQIEEAGRSSNGSAFQEQIDMVYQFLNEDRYSVIDYELLFRTPEHDDRVKSSRRHSYLDDQRDRFQPTLLPSHLANTEILGVPYIYGHAESTGGHLWVVGKNARLFDYFLPERWRKTPSLRLSDTNEVFYTITKDNIHLVWKTSRVGEIPQTDEHVEKIRQHGINSPFEEFATALTLNRLGIPCVYVRAIYMTGSTKIEPSSDLRRYDSHKHILDAEGNPILQENRNYITIRGYYNGPDEYVAEHEGELFSSVDLDRAVRRGIITESQSRGLLARVIENARNVGYDGSLLKANDLLLVIDNKGNVIKQPSGDPKVIICNFELIWKIPDTAALTS